MSSTKRENQSDIESYKTPFSVSQLIISLLLGTYFLTVEIIELSLSTYAWKQNKLEVYQQYLIFKSEAPIWKYWQLFTTLIVPLTIFATTKDLFQILTKKATTQRHLLDIIAAFQLYGILYTIIARIMPLESRLIEETSKDIAHDLNMIHWIAFMLNILGWCIPIFRYRESKYAKYFHLEKKKEE
ncbi:unnamed protein product [Rotaria socialis]|uniref:Uncharacterized protein n=2 Tax=Rotaria socialis TaxID=392032 RepID=A0A820XJZ4_9BILA|nr:unnamed protein product [Rotaria socialis]CAF3495367.1 unnamed protein product [Rotaria socialis]CAF4301576.1 unnamed protein product [Rotaria socialis]CAF4533919.1 unnamed protein product [Rotaria socialis]